MPLNEPGMPPVAVVVADRFNCYWLWLDFLYKWRERILSRGLVICSVEEVHKSFDGVRVVLSRELDDTRLTFLNHTTC